MGTVLMDFVTRNDYNTPQVIEDYQQTIHQLLDGSAKSVGFAVGCFNHWISFAASTASGSLEILLSDSQNRTVFRFNSREECVQAHEAAEERDKDSFIVREMNHMDVSQAQKEHWWMYGGAIPGQPSAALHPESVWAERGQHTIPSLEARVSHFEREWISQHATVCALHRCLLGESTVAAEVLRQHADMISRTFRQFAFVDGELLIPRQADKLVRQRGIEYWA